MFRIIIIIILLIIAMPTLQKCSEDTGESLKKAKAVGTVVEKAFRYKDKDDKK